MSVVKYVYLRNLDKETARSYYNPSTRPFQHINQSLHRKKNKKKGDYAIA